jgi:1-acyl-sn-glycerol-3-phosphate acyltransferase
MNLAVADETISFDENVDAKARVNFWCYAWVKLLLFSMLCSLFFITEAVLHMFSLAINQELRSRKIQVSRFYNRALVKILGLQIRYTGNPSKPHENFLLVANHLSYLDVIIFASLFPACFVTSVEMRHAAFLGWICRATGCLFVERRSRVGLDGEIQKIANELVHGNNVMLFPEGTSTDGTSVSRFRRPLFQAAIAASRRVAVLVINYRNIDNESVDISNRDRLFWYGKMTFFDHFLGVLKMRSITVDVSLMGVLDSTHSRADELASAAQLLAESGFQELGTGPY